jgi:hypothetical protein
MLGINLTKDIKRLYNDNHKALKKEISRHWKMVRPIIHMEAQKTPNIQSNLEQK